MTRADPHSGAAALRVRAHLGEEAPQRIVRCRLQCCGPIATPGDATHILARCSDCHGFYGASSLERLPTEVALTEQTRRFKAMERPRTH